LVTSIFYNIVNLNSSINTRSIVRSAPLVSLARNFSSIWITLLNSRAWTGYGGEWVI